MTQHTHNFIRGKSGTIMTCVCGQFRFTPEYLAKHPPIVVPPAETARISEIARGHKERAIDAMIELQDMGLGTETIRQILDLLNSLPYHP